ncbi:hypothetical protein QJQ45_024059, partial [Haematococcus lacustris]
MALGVLWRRVTEGRWAQNLLRRLPGPGPRQEQEAMDHELLYMAIRAFEASSTSSSKLSVQQSKELLHEVRSMTRGSIKAAVNRSLGQQLVCVAHTLHSLLAEAGDPAPAAAGMLAAAQRIAQRDSLGWPCNDPHSQQLSASRHSLAAATSHVPHLTRLTTPGSPGQGAAAAVADQQHPPGQCHQQAGQQPGTGSGSGSRAEGGVELGAGSAGSPPGSAGPPGGLRQAQLSEQLRQRLGHSLRVAPSKIRGAGLGLFLEGSVAAGALVAVVPGISYLRTQLQHMPHFPQVSLHNDFLSCRFDMTILDSKAWGAGAQHLGTPDWPSPGSGPPAAALSSLEGRHPLALGHWVNHPAPGQQPNVLEAAVDLGLDLASHPPWLRAYLPAAPLLRLSPGTPPDAATQDLAEALLLCSYPDLALAASATRGRWRGLFAGDAAGVQRWSGMVLVAIRPLSDGEELLQNYRLSPHAPRPAWYFSHDPDQEQR